MRHVVAVSVASLVRARHLSRVGTPCSSRLIHFRLLRVHDCRGAAMVAGRVRHPARPAGSLVDNSTVDPHHNDQLGWLCSARSAEKAGGYLADLSMVTTERVTPVSGTPVEGPDLR